MQAYQYIKTLKRMSANGISLKQAQKTIAAFNVHHHITRL